MDKQNNKIIVGGILHKIAHKMSTNANRDMQEYNLTGVQAKVLIYLYFNSDKQEIYQKDIEQHLNLTNPTVTGIVKRLEEKGMIKRYTCENDARYRCHILTAAGFNFSKYAWQYFENEKEAQLLSGFSKDERDVLISLLNRVLKNLEES